MVVWGSVVVAGALTVKEEPPQPGPAHLPVVGALCKGISLIGLHNNRW